MNQWGTICGSSGFSALANVICRQLGYSYFNSTLYYYGRGSEGTYLLYTQNVFCTGNETRLQDCYHTFLGYHQCSIYQSDIGLQCQAYITGTIQCASGSFQLVGGSAPSEGKVEICLGGNWSTICAYPSHSDSTNAAAICQQLGFQSSGKEFMHRRKCAQGSGLAVGIEANCIGNETSFLQCLSNYYICNEHVNDIGVRCAPASSSQCQDGDVRLVNVIIGTTGHDSVEGMVHICYGGHWGMAIGPSWTLREASVICRQLHYAPVALKVLTYPTNNPNTLQFYCVGYEKTISDCYHTPQNNEFYK